MPATESYAGAPRTAIAVEGVTKAFGTTPVITGIDLDIRAGELIALLGPSGSGKTTLLRIIAGLETADAGRIVFGGADQTRVPVQRREVGFVFQHYALFKHMTIADNIAYGLMARRRRDRPARDVVAKRVGDLLDLIKLSKFAKHYPAQLSGGQRQRVALARALAVDPRVLLLDEPFGALDAQVRKDLRRWLRDIHQRTGQTTIFVTHDQEEALELSDRVAILHEGRLEQVGTPFEVQDRPATVAVLKFLGDALEVPADVDGGVVTVAGRPVPVAAGGMGAGRARLFVRPWHFARINTAEADVRGTVLAVYRAGGRTHVSLSTGEAAPITVALDGDVSIVTGETLGLAITGGHLLPS